MTDGAEWQQQIEFEEHELYELENGYEHSNDGHRPKRYGQEHGNAQFQSCADPFDSGR
jgi:hypothetical protein